MGKFFNGNNKSPEIALPKPVMVKLLELLPNPVW
jgi:hypothetical protein